MRITEDITVRYRFVGREGGAVGGSRHVGYVGASYRDAEVGIVGRTGNDMLRGNTGLMNTTMYFVNYFAPFRKTTGGTTRSF